MMWIKIQECIRLCGNVADRGDDPCGICFILHVFPELENGIFAGYSHALLRCGGKLSWSVSWIKFMRISSEENAVLTTVAEENLAGVRTVKAFAREDYEIKNFCPTTNAITI